MTDNSIQQARDVLAKWRKWMSPDPWTISESAVKDTSGSMVVDYGDVKNLVARHAARQNLCLIVGTAGNPDLLDAIDGMLGIFENEPKTAPLLWPELWAEVQRIAAAIIAADERMTL